MEVNRTPLWWIAALTVVIALCYAPVVLSGYAYADDYTLLRAALAHDSSTLQLLASGGRPLLGFILDAAFRWAGSIEGLRWVRLVTVIGIVLLGAVVQRALVRSGWRPVSAFCITVVVCTMPPLRLYAFWSQQFAYPFAAALSGLAFHLADRGGSAGRPRLRDVVGAIVCLFVAFTIYQPAAVFFWVFAAIAVFGPTAPSRPTWPSKTVWLIVFAVAAALGLVVAKLGNQTFHALPPDRSNLTRDPIGKLRWFLEGPLVDALHLPFFGHRGSAAALVAAVIVLGLVLFARQRGCSVPLLLGSAAALLGLAFSPTLVIQESWTSYRTELALTSIVVVLAGTSLHGYAQLFDARRRSAALLAAATLGAVLCATVSARDLVVYMVAPQVTELAWARHRVGSAIADGAVRQLHVKRASWYDSSAPRKHYDEIGLPSLSITWSAVPMVELILRERGVLLPVTMSGLGEPLPPLPPGTAVIDAHDMRVFRPAGG